MWKCSIINATNHIFPGLSCHDRRKEFYDTRNEIKSSLALQIALYLNVHYLPIWIFIVLYYLNAKYDSLSGVYKFVSIAITLAVIVLEFIRLYLGYLGNLGEKIPELASFWIISTLLQFPLEIFLVFDQNSENDLNEKLFNGIALTFLLIEILTGTLALKQSADHHAKRFYIAHMYEIEDSIK